MKWDNLFRGDRKSNGLAAIRCCFYADEIHSDRPLRNKTLAIYRYDNEKSPLLVGFSCKIAGLRLIMSVLRLITLICRRSFLQKPINLRLFRNNTPF